uniref:PEGA domain-containing protein n=1 Tax=Agathobacter sp. TaxID=2021311 RepID=UPI003FF0C2D4
MSCVVFLLALVMLSGCGKETVDDGMTYFHHSIADQTEEDTQETQQQEVYLITGIDQTEESLRLYRYANGMEYRFYYGTGTQFFDKYGNRSTMAAFPLGSLVTIGEQTLDGTLSEVQLSDEAWVYEDITRFSVNEEKNMLMIADRKYRYKDNTYVFSGDEKVDMTGIRQGDTLTVVGIDKQILSVNITTAQGTLALKNTSLFEGSFLQLGKKIFTEITPDLTLQVPEGKYTLTVANNGWGGSKKIKIKRGKTTTVDLNELKGEGPQYGKIKFSIDVEDALLLVDGKQTETGKTLKLTYGSHDVTVYADGYDVWKRNLYVNSPEATIIIKLKDEEDSESSGTSSSQNSLTANSHQENSQSSQPSQRTENTTSESEKSESEKRDDETDILKDLLSSLYNTSTNVSK